MHITSLLLAGLASSAAATSGRGPSCTEFMVEVTASSNNQVINASASTSSPPIYQKVSGKYNISARYCEPVVVSPSHVNTLQFLVHGISYNKNYWSGLGYPGYQPQNYSWIDYASNRGYPTLSIDTLGAGNSDHPDPVAIVQLPLQVSIIYEIISRVKSGHLLPRPFTKVIYASHSYGSSIGNALGKAHPSLVDALLLTGYSYKPASSPNPFGPANNVSARFANLPSGYLTATTQAGREALLFGPSGSYDPILGAIDFSVQDIASSGEFATIEQGLGVCANYTGPVHVITGAEDHSFCADGQCGSGSTSLIAETKQLFPNANYSYFEVPNTGHVLNLHYTAQETFQKAHEWLESIGL